MSKRTDAKATRWPQLVIALILFFFFMTGWSIFRAMTGVSTVTNPRYYSHGLKYNETLIEKEAAESLGWQVHTSLADRTIEARLTDREGRPVKGAQAELFLFHEGPGRAPLPLREREDGRYAANLPEGISGQLSARLKLTREGATLWRELAVNL